MREVTIQRKKWEDWGTEGDLTVKDSDFKCKTLELPFKLNKKRISSIIPTSYICEIVNSPKFGKVYEVKSVRERGDILIHAGNFAGDTEKGLKSDSMGCILLGDKITNIGGQMGISNSKNTLLAFMHEMNGEKFILNIKA
jgi:hypothetical protein